MQTPPGMRRRSAAWYLVAFVPFVIGAIVAVQSVFGVVHEIEAMPRVLVPGERTLTLEAGEYVVYAESRSVIDGVSHSSITSFSGGCGIVDQATGASLAIEAKTGSSEYNFGGYEGHSAFEFTAPRTGEYRVICTAESGQGVIAIGDGIGMNIIWIVVSVFGGIAATALTAVLVYRWRRPRSAQLA